MQLPGRRKTRRKSWKKRDLARRDETFQTQGAAQQQTGPHGGKARALKASVRAKVEHPFHVVKNLFRHRKARYRGLEKNTAQLFTLFGFANLVLAGRQFTVSETRAPS